MKSNPKNNFGSEFSQPFTIDTDDLEVAQARIAELEREVARYSAMIPVECCAGANPNCYGPRGCLVRAKMADLTPNDVLAERVIDLEHEVARARAEEREAIVGMIEDARIESLYVAEDRCNIIRIIRSRGQESHDG